jgi:hypothetical protein
MKKFIVAIDGLKYSTAATEYAVHFARQANAHLVGVFLDDFTYHSYKIYELISEDQDIMDRRMEMEKRDQSLRAQSVTHFETACQKAGLEHTIHHDRNIALQELLHESIYADLLIIDKNETLTHYDEEAPTRFMRDLLASVQCPVLVVPPRYQPVSKAVVLFDGSPSSVHAVRMFSYTLSALKYLDVEVLTVKKEDQHLHVPDNRLMKEFMKRHYPNAAYTVLRGEPAAQITYHLGLLPGDAIVVLGAYHRGMVSRWFNPSMADLLMKKLGMPLFIAHNK